MKIIRVKDKNLNTWIWKADFTYKGKRWRPVAVRKEELEEIITQIKSNANRKQVGLDSHAPKISLQQLFDEHKKTLDLTKKNHRRAKVILQDFLKFDSNAQKAVEEIEAAEIHAYIRDRKSKSVLKPESVNKDVGYISAMLREASNYFKPLAKYTRPKMPWEAVPKDTNQRVIYKDEREALLSHLSFTGLYANEKPTSRIARFEYADMFEIAYHTAMRWGEIHLIEWRMIDWRKAELFLPREVTKAKSGRTVYLNSRAIEILKRRKHTSISIYVFPGNTPDVPRKYYYEGIRRAAKKIGLPFGRDVGFTLHSTKHTALTDVVERTGDVKAAQGMGGHSRATMTQKYLHTDAKRMRHAVEKLTENTPDSDRPSTKS